MDVIVNKVQIQQFKAGEGLRKQNPSMTKFTVPVTSSARPMPALSLLQSEGSHSLSTAAPLSPAS